MRQQSKSVGVTRVTADYLDPPDFPVGDMSRTRMQSYANDMAQWWLRLKANLASLENDVKPQVAITDSRIRSAFSASPPINYDSATGTFSFTSTETPAEDQPEAEPEPTPETETAVIFPNLNTILPGQSLTVPVNHSLSLLGPVDVSGRLEVAGILEVRL